MLTYYRIQSIEDKYFPALHQLLGNIFPPEEVLAFDLWKAPLEDPTIHVYVALLDDRVVGSTEYRYYPHLQVAMTDFTIIGEANLGIGRFLYREREKDIARLELESNSPSLGMFAEVYDPMRAEVHSFANVSPMNPYVRREVLSHIGYKRIDVSYVHPSWDHEGQAVTELDLCFLPKDEQLTEIPTALIVTFLNEYYAALPNKPDQWHEMIKVLSSQPTVALKPL
jgi:hypothetical protein